MNQPLFHILNNRMWALAYILLLPISLSAQQNKITVDTVPNVRQLDEFTVDGKSRFSDKIGHVSVSAAEINRTPTILGERDLIKTLQSGSGVVSGTEGFAGLYVRGGENDQNLYIIDGLPLLNVYHFGGLFSTFSSHSLSGVDFYKGAFPSYFSERASSIVDISLKKPDLDKTTGVFSIGLISGQLYLSTPIRKESSAISIALRRTWFDIFTYPALAILNKINHSEGKKIIFNYNFTDLTLKFRLADRRNNELDVIAFYGYDNFKLGEDRFDPNDDNTEFISNLNKMAWGNLGISALYRHSSDCGTLKLKPYATRAFASDKQKNIIIDDESQPSTLSSRTAPSVFQFGIKESFDFPIAPAMNGTVGMEQNRSEYNVGTATFYEEPTTGLKKQYGYTLLSAFGELKWNVADVFTGSIGLRANRFLSKDTKHLNLEPRVNMRFKLPSSWNLSMSYSRMTQYAQQPSSTYIYLPSDAWLPTACKASPLISDIYSLGVFKTFERICSVKGEVWWKDMRNIADFKPNLSMLTDCDTPWYDRVTFGKGTAYGLDIEANGKYKSIDWSVAYGLMWNWRKFDDINDGNRFPSKFDNRNKIDIGINWKISNRVELSGQWEYMTGNRATVALYNIAPPDVAFPNAPFVNPLDPYGQRKDGIDYLSGRNNIRLPAFHRLNLNLCVKGRLNDRLTYQWDFGLYNAYSRMNPFSVVKNYYNLDWVTDGSYRKFKTLSLLPIIPSVSYTLNF